MNIKKLKLSYEKIWASNNETGDDAVHPSGLNFEENRREDKKHGSKLSELCKDFLSVLHWSNVREQEEKFEVMKFVKDLA